MKRAFSLIAILAMLLMASCSQERSAQVTSPEASTFSLKKDGAQSYADFQGVAAPEVSNARITQVELPAQGNLQFFSTEASFAQESCAEFRRVTFENSKVPPSFIGFFRGLFDSNTNNEVFGAGSVPNGFSMATYGGGETMVVLTTGFIGLPSTVIGPNFFVANLNLFFDHANIIAMDLYDPFGPATLDVEVYGSDGSLLAVFPGVLTGTTVPTFFAVIGRGLTISRIQLRQTAGGGGELVDNVIFASCGI